MFLPKIEILAVDEIDRLRGNPPTHIISIRNPGAPSARPAWFIGRFLELFFGDVVSARDAEACRSLPPALEHIQSAVEFTTDAFQSPKSKTLIFCDYGAARSPALAYVTLAAHGGLGCELEAFEHVISIRSCAVPNMLVVRLGDSYLDRKGTLIAPCRSYLKELFGES